MQNTRRGRVSEGQAVIDFLSPLSALILCYFVSRVTWRIFARVGSPVRLLAAHLLSVAILYVAIGFWKSYFVPFAFDEARVVVLPQLFWLVIDSVRGRLKPIRGS